MRNSFFNGLRGVTRNLNQWFLRTPERALDDAYEAALKIKSIEDTHFNGGRISPDYGNYGSSVRSYFQSELRKYLRTARVRLAEFNLSSSMVRSPNQSITQIEVGEEMDEQYRINVIDRPAVILRKLRFIDEVISKYNTAERDRPANILVVSNKSQLEGVRPANGSKPMTDMDYAERPRKRATEEDMESFADKTGVLPRSILRTVDRIKRELNPEAENEVVENFRSSKARTVVALRLVLLLILLPLLTQQVSKNFVIGPIIDHFRSPERTPEVQLFLNIDMEEEALAELQRYEERLKFEALIGRSPRLTEEELGQKLQEKAAEIQAKTFVSSNNAIKNIFSDVLSALVFALVLVSSKRDVTTLKLFIDELVYGLSDSAKAFIIILFTDIFVGFHSPHGWEVILEGVSRHFGLAANRDFIFLFIATFPVILDTIFKYWIFRYLNRISPSAVATYRNMNE